MGDQVGLVREDRVATVTLNRPDRRNSLSDAMLTELATTFTVLRDDAEIRAVVVTGAPPAEKTGGAPVTTTARISASSLSTVNVVARAVNIASRHELRRSGRCRVTEL